MEYLVLRGRFAFDNQETKDKVSNVRIELSTINFRDFHNQTENSECSLSTESYSRNQTIKHLKSTTLNLFTLDEKSLKFGRVPCASTDSTGFEICSSDR